MTRPDYYCEIWLDGNTVHLGLAEHNITLPVNEPDTLINCLRHLERCAKRRQAVPVSVPFDIDVVSEALRKAENESIANRDRERADRAAREAERKGKLLRKVAREDVRKEAVQLLQELGL